MPLRVTAAHPTPNPNAMKYGLDAAICDEPVSFFTPDAGRDHPIARKLFAIDGVESVLLLHDFVTINKTPAAKWKSITPAVKKVIAGIDAGAAGPSE